MKTPLVIVLDRLRSAHNVGNIFRLAEALNAGIIGCGATPMPPHPKLEKTAMGADKMVPFRIFRTALEAVQAMHADGIPVYAVETVPDAVDAWDFPYPEKVAILLGNEALGISADALAETDGAVSLPMLGEKASINVGNCTAVVLYAICKQRKGS